MDLMAAALPLVERAPRAPERAGAVREERALGRRPQLDGLRALAWAAVFLGHAGLTWEPGVARVAMYLFFGLSGFLITALLADERARRGRVSLSRFFARRALRLAPGLLAFLAVWLLVVAALGDQPWMTTVAGTNGGPQDRGDALWGAGAALVYGANWAGIYHGIAGWLPLGHLWSLSVEEQFYLLWAPLLALLLWWRRRRALLVALVVAAASVTEAVWVSHRGHGSWAYMGTDCRVGAFLVGGAFALAWTSGRLRALRHPAVGALLGPACLLALALSAAPLATSTSLRTLAVGWTAATVAGPLLVVTMVERSGGAMLRLFSHPVAVYLGRRSYALYLWHYVFLTWFNDRGLLGTVLALAATLAAAELSWQLVEAPALRLKDRRFSSAGSKVVAPAPAVR
jgi:peptidoglycan/LPS O-acetylase OafA/YrhL